MGVVMWYVLVDGVTNTLVTQYLYDHDNILVVYT
jgi:hypothetical protein